MKKISYLMAMAIVVLGSGCSYGKSIKK